MGAILSPVIIKERQKQASTLGENQSVKSNPSNKPPILTFNNQTLLSILGYQPMISNLEHQAALSIFQHQPIIEAFQQLQPPTLAKLHNHALITSFHKQPIKSYFGYEQLKSPRKISTSNTADIISWTSSISISSVWEDTHRKKKNECQVSTATENLVTKWKKQKRKMEYDE